MHSIKVFKDTVQLRHDTPQISVDIQINGALHGLAGLGQSFELTGCGK